MKNKIKLKGYFYSTKEEFTHYFKNMDDLPYYFKSKHGYIKQGFCLNEKGKWELVYTGNETNQSNAFYEPCKDFFHKINGETIFIIYLTDGTEWILSEKFEEKHLNLENILKELTTFFNYKVEIEKKIDPVIARIEITN